MKDNVHFMFGHRVDVVPEPIELEKAQADKPELIKPIPPDRISTLELLGYVHAFLLGLLLSSIWKGRWF